MLLEVVLPLSLAVIMFSLGVGLTIADFRRVVAMPRAVTVGLCLQLLGIPVLAFCLLQVVNLQPALAFGVMLLAFCPGGVTSNVLTKLGGGSVALSITMTAIASLASVFTVPIFVGLAASHFLGAAAPQINVTSIAVAMFLITALPVLLGLGLRGVAPAVATRIEPVLAKIAVVLFVIIIVGALAANWALFWANFAQLGPVLIAMVALAVLIGLGVARLLGLSGPDRIAIAVELGVQNGTLGIAVAGLIAGVTGLSDYALPSAAYGIFMYVVTVPAILALRKMG